MGEDQWSIGDISVFVVERALHLAIFNFKNVLEKIFTVYNTRISGRNLAIFHL